MGALGGQSGGTRGRPVRGVVEAGRDAVLDAASDPVVLLDSIPGRYVEAVDRARRSVIVKVSLNPFSSAKFAFTAGSARRGDAVELALTGERVYVEFTVRAEEAGGKTVVTVEPRLAGISTDSMWRFAVEVAQSLIKNLGSRAAAAKPAAKPPERPAEPRGEAVVAVDGKLEDPLFEAEVTLRGRILYSDVATYTTLGSLLSSIPSGREAKTIYVRVTFSDGYVLRLLVGGGRLLGAVGALGGRSLRGEEAVREAERRAPSSVLVIAYEV